MGELSKHKAALSVVSEATSKRGNKDWGSPPENHFGVSKAQGSSRAWKISQPM